MGDLTASKRSWLQPVQHVTFDEFMRGAAFNILLVIASGVLASFMFPPREVWWFAWLYLTPLLIALRRTATVRAAGWLMLLFGVVFLASTLSWLNTIFGISAIGIFVLISLPWLLFGLAYRVLTGQAAARSSSFWAAVASVILTPVFWLAVEWIRCEGWYFQFSWAQFGFAMASCRRGGVLYPYIGVYGVTFLIMLANAIFTEIFMLRKQIAVKLCWFALAAAPFIALSFYINVLIGIPNTPGETTDSFRVGIVQNESGSLGELKSQTERLATMKPNLIVWPEYAVVDYPLTDNKLLSELQTIARTTKSTLILGCKEHLPENTKVDWLRKRAMLSMEGALFGNAALVIAPDGRLLGVYHKTHPIQFFSDGVPGQSFPTFATPVGRVGIAICYDFDFASCPLRLVKNGAELLVTPTFDSGEWTELQHVQHARMAQARAAEMDRWVVRPTTSGVSQVINPMGFVVSSIQGIAPDNALGVAVPQRTVTPYVRFMYRLPMLCLLISLLWCLRFVTLRH